MGLGNPGPRYRATRHNVGFEALDRILEASGGRWKAATNESVSAEITLEGKPLTVVKPVTVRKRRGRAVASTSRLCRRSYRI